MVKNGQYWGELMHHNVSTLDYGIELIVGAFDRKSKQIGRILIPPLKGLIGIANR